MGHIPPRVVGCVKVLDALEAWTAFYLFLPGVLKLQIGLSRAINLLLLTSAYSHLFFLSIGFLMCKNGFPVDGGIATCRS